MKELMILVFSMKWMELNVFVRLVKYSILKRQGKLIMVLITIIWHIKTL